MPDSILVINAGSSSIKFQLFSVGDGDRLERRMKGQMDGIGSRPRLLAKGADGKSLVDRTWRVDEVSGVSAALDKVVEFLREVEQWQAALCCRSSRGARRAGLQRSGCGRRERASSP